MATTINAYSVSLGLDARSFIDTARLTRAESAALTKDIVAARTPMEKFGLEYDRLEKAYQSGAISLGVYTRLIDEARSKLAAATPVVKTAAQAEAEYNKQLAETNRLRTAFGRTSASPGLAKFAQESDTASNSLLMLGSRFAGPLAAVAALKSSVGASFENQNAVVSLEVLLGSAQEAAIKLKALKQIDATSPLTLDSAVKATRTLLSFGVAADQIIPTVKMLGDVTGADNERFKSMALAFAQVSAAGRLQGQDLRQMIDAGFNPLQEVSRKTGESLEALKKRMEDGKISSLEIANAFKSATSEGGKFNGMMDRLGETASGKLGQALSQITQMGVQIGDSLSPLIVQAVDLFGQIRPILDPVLWVINKMGQGLAYVLGLVNDIVGLFRNFLALANNEMTLSEYFAFENSNKVLNDIEKAKVAQQQLAESATSTTNATKMGGDAIVATEKAKAAAVAATTEKIKQQEAEAKKSSDAAKRRKEQEKAFKEAGEDFEKSIKSMQDKVLSSKLGGGKKDTKEIDAIRQLFDKTDLIGRNSAGLFEYWIEKGIDYNKHLDLILNKDQQAQLDKFRSLVKQTEQIDKQEKIKQDGEKERARLAEAAKKIVEENNPVDKLARELNDLDKMRRAGMIDDRTLERERNRLAKEATKDTKSDVKAASLEVGSAEAYKFLTGQTTDKMTEQLNEAKQQRLLLAAQNKILEDIRNKPTVSRKR